MKTSFPSFGLITRAHALCALPLMVCTFAGTAPGQTAHEGPRSMQASYVQSIERAKTANSKRCAAAVSTYFATAAAQPRIAALHQATAAWRAAAAAGESWTPSAAHFMGVEWYGLDQPALACELLTSALAGVSDPGVRIDTLRLLGQTLMGLRQFDEAKAHLRMALFEGDIDGEDPHYLVSPCLTLLRMIASQENDHAATIRWTTAQIEFSQRHPSSEFVQEDQLQAQYQIIDAYAKLGDKQRAIALAQELLAQNPGWGYESGYRAYTVLNIVEWSSVLPDPYARIELVSPYLQDANLHGSPTFATITYTLGDVCTRAKQWEAAAELYALSAENARSEVALLAPDATTNEAGTISRDLMVRTQRMFDERAADSYVTARRPQRALDHIQAMIQTLAPGDPQRSELHERLAVTLALIGADPSDPRFEYRVHSFED